MDALIENAAASWLHGPGWAGPGARGSQEEGFSEASRLTAAAKALQERFKQQQQQLLVSAQDQAATASGSEPSSWRRAHRQYLSEALPHLMDRFQQARAREVERQLDQEEAQGAAAAGSASPPADEATLLESMVLQDALHLLLLGRPGTTGAARGGDVAAAAALQPGAEQAPPPGGPDAPPTSPTLLADTRAAYAYAKHLLHFAVHGGSPGGDAPPPSSASGSSTQSAQQPQRPGVPARPWPVLEPLMLKAIHVAQTLPSPSHSSNTSFPSAPGGAQGTAAGAARRSATAQPPARSAASPPPPPRGQSPEPRQASPRAPRPPAALVGGAAGAPAAAGAADAVTVGALLHQSAYR